MYGCPHKLIGNMSDNAQVLLKKYHFDPASLGIEGELKYFHAKFSSVHYLCEVRNELCGLATLSCSWASRECRGPLTGCPWCANKPSVKMNPFQ